VIDRVRYLFGVFNVVVLPTGLLFWFVVHPWARGWRRLGPIRTYLIVLPAVVAVGVVLFHARGRLLGADLGLRWSLITIALALYGVTVIELRYWRQLSVRTLIGIPELSSAEGRKDRLLTNGAYRAVRHPRYLSAGIGVVANALIINYAGVYVLVLLLFPAGYVMLMFEERELVDRFGEQYRQYQREVPQIIPRFRKTRRE
jgi:protein-S-isoprenylcysteine O-methyltransferase Ste14